MVTVTIPTKDRKEKLSKCVASILSSTLHDIKVVILCTNFAKDVEYQPKNHRIEIIQNPDMRVTEAQNFMIRNYAEGHVLPISDDMEFDPAAIGAAQYYLIEFFPDSDGVVGLNTVNFDAKDTSIMLIGEKFINRFPDRKIYFPGYKHFGADTELGNFAKRIGRFQFIRDAMVRHFHPACGVPLDETHYHGRKYLNEDLKLFEERERGRLVWGRA